MNRQFLMSKTVQVHKTEFPEKCITASTKQRLEELEAAKEQLSVSILQEQIKSPRLTREQISLWICNFRELDVTKSEHRQRLIDCFVNAVYVFDDKLVLTYNYKDGTETISLKDAISSDLNGCSPP